NFFRNARTVVLDRQLQQRRRVGKALSEKHPIRRPVAQAGQLHGGFQNVAGDIHRMRLRGALERVNGQVKEDLDEVGAVDLQLDVMHQAVDLQRVLSHAGMDAEQFAQVVQDQVDVDADGGRRLLPHETEVTVRNLDAVA